MDKAQVTLLQFVSPLLTESSSLGALESRRRAVPSEDLPNAAKKDTAYFIWILRILVSSYIIELDRPYTIVISSIIINTRSTAAMDGEILPPPPPMAHQDILASD